MAESDDFVRTTVSSILQPGEVILSMGWMAPLSLKWRDLHERFYAAGTNLRLIVIQTRQSLGLLPKRENQGITWMDYASMTEVGTIRFAALSDNLLIKGASGELRYCVPSPTIIGARSMDGHAQFNELYLLWLSRHVAAGSFRSAAGAQAAAAEWQDPTALDELNIRWAPKSQAAARRRFQRRIKWPFWLMAASLLVVFMGASQMGSAHGRRAEADAKQIIFLGFGMCAAFFVLGVVLNVRRRIADNAAARAALPAPPAA